MRRRATAVWIWLWLAAALGAHDGPPYAILVDRPAGAVLLSAWADPDVGVGTYHVYLEELEGRALPETCAVTIFVRPVTGRLAEKGYEAKLERRNASRYHYVGETEFDAPEDWTTRIAVRCGGEEGEVETVVAVTPPGQGPVLDFVLYLLPFVAVGFLAVRALLARRGPGKAVRE